MVDWDWRVFWLDCGVVERDGDGDGDGGAGAKGAASRGR